MDLGTGWAIAGDDSVVRWWLMFGRWRTRGCGDRSLRCSFCGKPRNKVKFLVAGLGVYICNACVDLCNKVIAKERALSS